MIPEISFNKGSIVALHASTFNASSLISFRLASLLVVTKAQKLFSKSSIFLISGGFFLALISNSNYVRSLINWSYVFLKVLSIASKNGT